MRFCEVFGYCEGVGDVGGGGEGGGDESWEVRGSGGEFARLEGWWCWVSWELIV